MNTTPMDDDELLSALADDALPADALHALLAKAPQRGEQHRAAQKLARYALLGELMRSDADSPLCAQAMRPQGRDVVAKVMQQIASEQAIGQARSPAAIPQPATKTSSATQGWAAVLGGWRLPAVSMALAASVAAVMLLVSPMGHQTNAPNLLAEKAVPTPAASLPASLTASLSEAPDLTVPTSLAELEANADNMPDPYLLQHLAHAEGGPVRTLSSNVRLASYERP